jgi:putative FmdB family regulatory protein
MPIYEYICKRCNYTTEKLEKINEYSKNICPNCKEIHLERKISASNFKLKGNGWYKTDYKKIEKKDD